MTKDLQYERIKAYHDVYKAMLEQARKYGLHIARHLKRTFREKILEKQYPDMSAAAMTLGTAMFMVAGEDEGCESLLCEWVAEHFWAMKIEAALSDIERLHAQIVDGKHTKRRPFVFNDLDNRVWYELSEKKKVLVFDSQGRFKIMIWDKDSVSTRLHFRKAWRRSHYAFGKYLDRPSLKWYRDRDFKPEYGDCRDNGYLFTYSSICGMPGKVDHAHNHGSDIGYFLFEVQSTLTALKEEKGR